MTDLPFDIKDVTKGLMDEGKLIEAGWISLRFAAIPAEASDLQLREMRNAFFAGAQHLFASLMTALDPGDEPTEADYRRLDQIRLELDTFIEDFKKRIPTQGEA